MRQRSAIRNALEYCLALAVLKSLEWAPLPIANGLARCYARLLDLALPRLRRVAKRNLSFALPQANASEIIDAGFESIARVLVAFVKFPGMNSGNIHQWIRCEG